MLESYISRSTVIGITHIDSPVSFEFKTSVEPQLNQILGRPPVAISSVNTSPIIQLTFEIDSDKDFVFREIHKACSVLHGIIPIRSYELNQLIFPIDENPAIYAGVGSELFNYHEKEKDNKPIHQKYSTDEWLKRIATNTEAQISDYNDIFYRTYTPFFNVAYKETVPTDGKTTMVLFIQPVDMFSYFKSGVCYFLKDDTGVVKQEVVNKYLELNGDLFHNINSYNWIHSIYNLYSSDLVQPTTDEKGNESKSKSLLNRYPELTTGLMTLIPYVAKTDADEFIIPTKKEVTIEYKLFKTGSPELKLTQTTETKIYTNSTTNGEVYTREKYFNPTRFKVTDHVSRKDFKVKKVDDGDTVQILGKDDEIINIRISGWDSFENTDKKILFGEKLNDKGEVVEDSSKNLPLGAVGQRVTWQCSKSWHYIKQDTKTDVNDLFEPSTIGSNNTFLAYCKLADIQRRLLNKIHNFTADEVDTHIITSKTDQTYGRYVGFINSSKDGGNLKLLKKICLATTYLEPSDYINPDPSSMDVTNLIKSINESMLGEVQEKSFNDHYAYDDNLWSSVQIDTENSIIDRKLELFIRGIIYANNKFIINKSGIYVKNNSFYQLYEVSEDRTLVSQLSNTLIPYRIQYKKLGNETEVIALPETNIFYAKSSLTNGEDVILDTVMISKDSDRSPIAYESLVYDSSIIKREEIFGVSSTPVDPAAISNLCQDIYNNHITIFPELSIPYRKLINSIDESNFGDELTYRYTNTHTSDAYPLMYISDSTFTEKSEIPNPSIYFDYIVANKLNTTFVEAVQLALFDCLFATINLETIGSQYAIPTQPSKPKGVMEQYNIGATGTGRYRLAKSNKSASDGIAHFISNQSLLSDIIYGDVGQDIVMLQGSKNIATDFATEVINNFKGLNNDQQTKLRNDSATSYQKNSFAKLMGTKKLEDNKIKSVLTPNPPEFNTYKQLAKRMFSDIRSMVEATRYFIEISDYKLDAKSKEYMYELEVAVRKIDALVLQNETQIQKSLSPSFVQPQDCTPEQHLTILNYDAAYGIFTDIYNQLYDVIQEIVIVEPILFLNKRIEILESPKTSILAINHSYSSGNIPARYSDTSIGAHFQCLGSTNETSDIVFQTSDFTLIRQMLLIHYASNITAKHVVSAERARSSFIRVGNNSSMQLFDDRVKKIYKDVTSDPFYIDNKEISMNIFNNFLNSYGFKHGLILAISVANVENRIGLYTVTISIQKTIPKKIVSSGLKAFGKNPIRQVVTNWAVSLTGTNLKELKQDIKPKVEYIQQASIFNLIPIILLSQMFLDFQGSSTLQGFPLLRNALKINYICNVSDFDVYSKSSFIDIALMFVDSLKQTSKTSIMDTLLVLKDIFDSLIYNSEFLTPQAKEFEIYYAGFHKRMLMMHDGKLWNYSSSLSDFFSNPGAFKSTIADSIDDIIEFFLNDNTTFMDTAYMQLMILKFGDETIKFKFKMYARPKFDEKLKEEEKDMVFIKSAFCKTNGEIWNTAKYIQSLYEEDLLNIDRTGDEYRNLTNIMKQLQSDNFNSRKLTNTYSSLLNKGAAFKIDGDYFIVSIKMDSDIIRHIFSIDHIILKAGFNSISQIDDLWDDDDAYDSPITAQMLEFYQLFDYKNYLPIRNESDNITFERFPASGAISNDITFDYEVNRIGKKNMRETWLIGGKDQNIPNLTYLYKLKGKFAAFSNQNIVDNALASRSLNSFDLYSYVNSVYMDKDIIISNKMPSNSTFQIMLYSHFNNYFQFDSKNERVLWEQLVEIGEDGITADEKYHKLLNLPTNSINSEFLTNSSSSSFVAENPDTILNIYNRTLMDFMKVSIAGTNTYIIDNISENIYKTHIVEISFIDRFRTSKGIPKDVYFLVASALQFGTYGVNNPYNNSFFSGGDYGQTSLPIVYAYPKRIIVELMVKEQNDDIKNVLTSLLFGIKTNSSPVFFIYEEFQNTNVIARAEYDMLSDYQNVLDNLSEPARPSTISIVNKWITLNREVMKSGADSVVNLKKLLRGFIINNSERDMIFAKLDIAIKNINSVSMFYMDEQNLQPNRVYNEDSKFNKAKDDENKRNLLMATDAIIYIFNNHIVSNLRIAPNSIDYSSISNAFTRVISLTQQASRSNQLMSMVDAIGVEVLSSNLNHFYTSKEINANNAREFTMLWYIFDDIKNSSNTISGNFLSYSSQMANEIRNSSTGISGKSLSLRLAFPTMKILIIKKAIPNLIIFDEFFSVSNIISTSVFSRMDSPAKLADIVISDPTNDISTVKDRTITGTRSKINANSLSASNVEDMNAMTLSEGSGLQIRMGFSRYLGIESIVFNGKIDKIGVNPDGTKSISAINFGGNLQQPVATVDANITLDNGDVTKRLDIHGFKDTDPVDNTIALDYFERFFYLKPEAFNGLYSEENNYNTNKPYAGLAVAAMTNLVKPRSTDIRAILMSKSILPKSSAYDSGFIRNVTPTRIGTNKLITYPDFVSIAGETVWDNLQQISNHYLNHHLLIRDFDTRETIVFSHFSSIYKRSNSFNNSNMNFESISDLFDPVGEDNGVLFENLLKKLKENINFKTKTTVDIEIQEYGPYSGSSAIVETITVPNYDEIDIEKPLLLLNSDGSLTVNDYYNLATLYIICTLFAEVIGGFINDNPASSPMSRLTNIDYDDLFTEMFELKTVDNKVEISGLKTEVIKVFTSASSDFNKLSTLSKEKDYDKTLDEYIIDKLWATGIGGAIGGATGLAADLALKKFFPGKAGNFIGKVARSTGLALGAAIGTAMYSGGDPNTSSGLTVYKGGLFLRLLRDSILSFSPNYRKISATHVFDNKNIIYNDLQVLRNGNTIAMKIFNENSELANMQTVAQRMINSSIQTMVASDSNSITVQQGIKNLLNSSFLTFNDRWVGNMQDPLRYYVLEFPFHSYLPGDYRNSIFTPQNNALFIKQHGLDEAAIVASSIMRKTINEYYGGNIIVIGNSDIMVGDKVSITDPKTQTLGAFEVREVLHSFSANTGFLTSVTPSLLNSCDENALYSIDGGNRLFDIMALSVLPVAMFAGVAGNVASKFQKRVAPNLRKTIKQKARNIFRKRSVTSTYSPESLAIGADSIRIPATINDEMLTSLGIKPALVKGTEGTINHKKVIKAIKDKFELGSNINIIVDTKVSDRAMAKVHERFMNRILSEFSVNVATQSIIKPKSIFDGMTKIKVDLKLLSNSLASVVSTSMQLNMLRFGRSMLSGFVVFPMKTTIGGVSVGREMTCIQRYGEPLIANLEGLTKAELLSKTKGNMTFRIDEAFRTVMEESVQEYYGDGF